MTLVDTPGMGSLSESLGRQAQDFLASELGDAGDADGVDAVIYLLRQLHASDVDFLEVLSDAQLSSTTPVNAVGVLSRADEIGGGAPDAIEQAHRIATRYREDPRMRGLVQTVLPVAGLLAEAATSLGPEEYADLGTLVGEAAELRAQLASERGTSTPGASSLTGAELRMLPLLATHLSYPEIAAELFVSTNTIKSQAYSLFRKLGASSRSQAVARSRELALLEG